MCTYIRTKPWPELQKDIHMSLVHYTYIVQDKIMCTYIRTKPWHELQKDIHMSLVHYIHI